MLDWLLWLYFKAQKPFLAAFAETVIGDDPGPFKPDGKKIMRTVDAFLHKVSPTVFRLMVGAIATLPLAVPPWPLPKQSFRRELRKMWFAVRSHFQRGAFLAKGREGRKAMVDTMFKRLALQAPEQQDDAIKTIISLTFLKGIFSSAYLDDETMWKALDYTPFTDKKGIIPPSGANLTKPPRSAGAELLHKSRKTLGDVATKPKDRRTYCVIGSGAGGAIAAAEIQRLDPNGRIVMLESGPLVTGDQMATRLLDSAATLYMNGAVTLSKDQQFIFRQGRGVGGSTLVNNSIAFKPLGFWWDQNIVGRWKSLGVHLEWDRLYAGYDELIKQLKVQEVDERVLTEGARVVKAGFDKVASTLHSGFAHTNSSQCIGCGRCNVGCQYDAKQSTMVAVIPGFVEKGGLLVPDAKVEGLELEDLGQGMQRVKSVQATDLDGRRYQVQADRFVLAAGAYASSKLLWRSGFTGAVEGVRTVGKRFSVNPGTPVVGIFPKRLNSFLGQQLGYALEVPEQRLVIESGFCPPGAIGFMTPQWGPGLRAKLTRLNDMTAAVPVIASLSYGEIKKGLMGESGFVIDYQMADEDWRRLEYGMKLASQVLFSQGAEEVFINRFDGLAIKSPEEIDEYYEGIGPQDFISVESAHMQGGNVIAPKPARGVVDSSMKVYGMDNLWIADASVIPSPITLNIALTVMALARYAAMGIAQS